MKSLVFDIGGTSIKYGVCEDGVLTDVRETPTEAYCGGRHVMDRIISLIEEKGARDAIDNANGTKTAAIDAIGISTAGQVDSDTGRIIYANDNIPGYTGIEIRKELEERFHVPVMVENDVNSAAMGEAVYGAGSAFEHFLCLTYGTGVGGAIIHHKELYRGSTFSAGEFGGIVTHGTRKLNGTDVFDGCYERFASTTALVNSVHRYNPDLSNGRKIFEQLADPNVKELIDAWIDEILIGLATVIHIFNPSCVVLGGGIMVQPYIIDVIKRKLPSHIMPSFAQVQIAPAKLGNSAGLLGIYYLAEQYVLSDKSPQKGRLQ